MSISHRITKLLFLGSVMIAGSVANAEEYPSKPITILVPYAAGGATDVTIRLLADIASQKFGQRVLVENRPGAGGGLMMAQLAQAAADGYTLGAFTSSPILVRPHVVDDAGYDPKTLTYIAQYLLAPQPVAVAIDSPLRTFQDLIDYAKENPSRLRYSGVAALGSAHIVLATAFEKEGVEAIHVPFQSGTEAATAFRGGQLDMVALTDYAALLDDGIIKILAEIGPERLPAAPEAPSFRELGYEVSPALFYGIGGPAGLPTSVVEKWDALVAEAMGDEAFVGLIDRLALIPAYAGPEQFKSNALADFDVMGAAAEALQ